MELKKGAILQSFWHILVLYRPELSSEFLIFMGIVCKKIEAEFSVIRFSSAASPISVFEFLSAITLLNEWLIGSTNLGIMVK